MVMECVGSVTYNVMHNMKELVPIHLRRELGQGDLLSPYLFIFCAEGLSSSLCDVQDRGLIHGCKLSKGPLLSPIFS